MDFDTLIRGALVFDGDGGPPVEADIALRGDQVEAMGELPDARAGLEVDATGLAAAPGFIDAHTHSDLVYLHGPDEAALAPVRQGVTSEICGNCGFSPFPHVPERGPELRRHVAALLGGSAGWRDLAGWRDAVEEAGLHANLAALVGHGSLRAGVAGFEHRAVRRDEAIAMVELAETCLEQGAVGSPRG